MSKKRVIKKNIIKVHLRLAVRWMSSSDILHKSLDFVFQCMPIDSTVRADWIVFSYDSSTGSQINSFSPAAWFAVCLSKNPISGEDSTRAKFPAIYKCPIRVAFYMEITFQDKERNVRSEVCCSWCVLLFLFHLKSRAVLPGERRRERESLVWI